LGLPSVRACSISIKGFQGPFGREEDILAGTFVTTMQEMNLFCIRRRRLAGAPGTRRAARRAL
jgi:hypothetical protein